MKKNLLFLCFALFCAFAKLNAQCTVSIVSVEVVNFNPGTCQITFNLSWQEEVNNGNKFAFIHLWKAADYHTPSANWTNMYSSPSNSPKAADLVNALATISIFDNGSATPTIGTAYPADASVIPLFAGLSIIKTPLPGGTSERMSLKNVTLTIPGCAGVIPLKADVWASQAANGKNVHCVTQDLNFDLKNPTLVGFKVCSPRSVTFGITNIASGPITLHFNLYVDNGDMLFNPGAGLDSVIYTSTDTTLSAGGTLSRFHFPYPGATGALQFKSLWLEAVVVGSSVTTNAFLMDPGCAPLPVEFKSFVAKRNGASVGLIWTTATEINNRGFNIQRQWGNSDWENIAFVPSSAPGGNSSFDLSYSYSDLNPSTAIYNYRLQQVDIDGNFKYSEIRAVRGESSSIKVIIYPNPSFNGKVNVLFDDANGTRDVSLIDMNGRTLQQWRGITNNNIQIENLTPGIYSLLITLRQSGEQSVEKIVVNKR